MSQSNTQSGPISLPAFEDLTGKEGLLVKVVSDAGVAKFALPDATTDFALYVLIDGDAAGKTVSALPLDPATNVRLRLNGACTAGQPLVLETPNGVSDGKVTALPTDAGTYRIVAVAEQDGIDEQFVKARPAPLGLITVTE